MRVFIDTNVLPSAAEFALIVQTPQAAVPGEVRVRDPKDRPILRAAAAAGCEALVTGDKDLLEAGITHPRVISPWLANTLDRGEASVIQTVRGAENANLLLVVQ